MYIPQSDLVVSKHPSTVRLPCLTKLGKYEANDILLEQS